MRLVKGVVVLTIVLTILNIFPSSAILVPQNGPALEVRPNSIYRPASLTSPGVPPYVPSDLQKAYNFLPLYSRGVTGGKTKIAIIDAFGDPSISSDLATFDSQTGLAPTTVNLYFPSGVPHRTNFNWALETALDVEWAHAIAPAANIDNVVAPDSSLGSILSAISFVASSLPNETVLSMSFGLSESLYPTAGSFTISSFHQQFVTISSHGTVAVASSGDSGASSCCNIQYPSSDPLILAVGGTTLTLNADASYSHEMAWTGSTAGSSIIYTKPSWQVGLGDAMRDVVDVSYDADLNTGVLVIVAGSSFQVGGTSAGAPQWAALLDLASQANSERLGIATPELYRASSFHDVTTGSNGFLSATTGWDYPTGLGSPDANRTVTALASLPAALASTNSLQGTTVTTTANLMINLSTMTLSGSAMVVARNSTTQATIFSKTYTIQALRLQNMSAIIQTSFLLNVPTKPYTLSVDTIVILTQGVATVTTFLTRQLDINIDGSVDIIDVSIMAVAFNSTIGGAGYNPLADFDANATIDIIDAGIIARYFNAPNLI